MEALTQEAMTLIETVNHSAETTVLSNIEIEKLIASHLVDSGLTLAELEAIQSFSSDRLARFAHQNDIFHIDVLDGRGHVILSSHPRDQHVNTLNAPLVAELGPLLKGTTRHQVLGLTQSPFGEGSQYLVAVARTNKQGFILLALDSRYLLEFRKRVGVGKLFQNIGDNRGIAYIVLQDDRGIVAASQNVSSMKRIEADSFLQEAVNADTLITRIVERDGVDILEVVKPLYVESGFYGIVRIGLSLDQLRALNERTIQRFIILSLAVILIGVVVFGFVSTTQSYSLLNEEYRKIQTYTGTILEHMADAVVATDGAGRITLFNKSAERLFHISADEVLGKNCAAIIEDPESCIERTLSSGQAITYEEAELNTRQLQGVIVGYGTSIIRNDKNEVDTVIAVIKDLANQRKTEEQLRRQEKLSAMGELASSVAHEILNPLNSISMTVQRFATDFEPREYQQEYTSLVKMMNEEVNRVSKIIRQFLQFARPPKLNTSLVPIDEFVQDVLFVVRSEAQALGIALKAELGYHGEIRIDREQMKQVLLNLIQNAFQAIGKSGEVRILTRTVENHLHLAITDTGGGVPLELLPKIFNLYFTTKPEGTGMGLSMASQIVTEHGGRIDVESELGKGTTFDVVLPLGE